MNNVEFLKDQIKYTGFGEGYENQLREKIAKGLPEFQLTHRAEFGGEVVTATLDFSRSKNSDLYFFNGFKAELRPEGASQSMSQTFRMGSKNNITLKEAFNLMNGRPIYKAFYKMEKMGEGEEARFVPTDEKYMAWKQMNFKETTKSGNFKLDTYTDNYGFRLEEELMKLPIRELQDKVASQRLVESLQKGNRQGVTFLQHGQEQQHYLVANPRFKRLDVYDADLKKLDLREDQSKNQKQEDTSQSQQKSERKASRKSVA